MTRPPDLATIYAARRRIAPHVRRTPLAHSTWLSDLVQGEVHLKLETLQITNSFKLRGAMNAGLQLVGGRARAADAGKPTPRVVTASAGNHGRALAYVADHFGLELTVFTPCDAPATKLAAIRRHGVDLRAEGRDYEDAERMAKSFAASQAVTYISPYSHPDIVAGAATLGVEIFEELPELDTIIVPVGGGGLVSGVASALKALAPAVETVGVEAEASSPFSASIATGRVTTVEIAETVADGLGGNLDPETITFDIASTVVDRWLRVPEPALLDGIRQLVAEEHLIAEGAGIAAVAAVLAGQLELRGRRAAVVVSGSNIDASRLTTILEAGRAAAPR